MPEDLQSAACSDTSFMAQYFHRRGHFCNLYVPTLAACAASSSSPGIKCKNYMNISYIDRTSWTKKLEKKMIEILLWNVRVVNFRFSP